MNLSGANGNNKDIVVERVCKKCGDPLRSTNKHNYCDNCRREKAKARRDYGALLGSECNGFSIDTGCETFCE